MKKMLLVFLVVPVFGIAQTKNVVTSSRYFAKPEKIEDFEKALANHAQKFHTGDWSWRVFDIMSGPDANGYMVVEGPNSWDQLDTRGDISPDHLNDFRRNVAPLSTDKGSSMYVTYRSDLSTVQLNDFADKIAINHIFVKLGFGPEFEKLLVNVKKAWEAGNQTMAVYESSSSGAPQYIIVARYKDGFKERDSSYRKPFKDRYIASNGDNSFEDYLQSIQKYVESSWGEILIYNKQLSSK